LYEILTYKHDENTPVQTCNAWDQENEL